MEINQGDIFWLDLGELTGSEPGNRCPFVVVQNNLFNKSRIQTIVLCALTTNLQRAKSPGNVLLDAGEGGLSKPSVVNITQIFTIDKSSLVEYSGTLKSERIAGIIQGLKLLFQLTEVD